MIRSTASLVAAVILAANFGSVSLSAAAPEKSPEVRFSKLDKNGDNKLSLDEFVGKKTDDKKDKATKRFKKLDSNSDESLSLDEFKAGQKPKA